MSEFTIKPAYTLHDALAAAAVRNTGSEFMTNDKSKLTITGQTNWFHNIYMPAHERGEMFLLLGEVNERPAAYGLIREKDGDFWLTGVVRPDLRGKGIGGRLFRFMSDMVLMSHADRVKLDVLATNLAARALYTKLGYCKIAEHDGIETMVLEGKVL